MRLVSGSRIGRRKSHASVARFAGLHNVAAKKLLTAGDVGGVLAARSQAPTVAHAGRRHVAQEAEGERGGAGQDGGVHQPTETVGRRDGQ